MTSIRLIIQTLKHYPWSSLATAAGITITTAVICGALIIGHSLSRSLEQIVEYRLGSTTHTITAGERIFTIDFASRLNEHPVAPAAPVLTSEAIASVQETGLRVNKVQVWGVDKLFGDVTGLEMPFEMEEGEVIISENLAARLSVKVGDFILLRLITINPIPSNTPFVSETGQTVTRRVSISRIISKKELGHFNMQASQTAPYNVFVNLFWLNQIMELDDRANMILLNASESTPGFDFQTLIRERLSLKDLGLNLAQVAHTGQWKLTAERVFLDESVSDEISVLFTDAKPFLTYFANSLKSGLGETPYSFVSATSDDEFISGPNDMVVNQWLADDLEVEVGDSITMRYFVVGPLRELEEHDEKFRISAIIPMELATRDSILMPHLPGLSDAGSCRDWDTGIPIDLDKIRQKDEDYWDVYKGTPKAWITLEKGQQLWQNRFGNLTTVIFPADHYDGQPIQTQLTHSIDPFGLEYRVNAVRQQGLEAARGGVDFGQLFAGLGMFIIISGLLLTVLLLQYSLQKRLNQIQLFASLGFSKNLIRKIILTESFFIIVLGALAGVALSVGYTRLVFSGLNRIWYDIVRTDTLILHYNFTILAFGWLAGVIAGMVVVFAGVGKIIRRNLSREAVSTHPDKRWNTVIRYLTILFLVFTIGFVVYALFFETGPGLFVWLIAGIALLLASILGMLYFLRTGQKPGSQNLTINLLSWKNLTRNPARSFTIITLLALGSFVIVVTAANQKDISIDPADKTGGTGGFAFMAETTVPVMRNLNEPDTQYEFGLPEGLSFVQFFTTYDDDASCLNLNRVANPRLLAVDPTMLESRFSFAAAHPLLNTENPWLSLEMETGSFIPAIADQSVIQWGLGKKVGDTLFYINADGKEVKLLLIGGLENSVLQGNVMISQKHFLKNFPSSNGSSVFLMESDQQLAEESGDELPFIFRDYGWEMISTGQKLAEFNTVENTYLQIFFLMGALGMLLGTIGLSIVIAKSMLERSNETAMFDAMGFPSKTIHLLYFMEYTLLFLIGLLSGTISGLIATMPSYLTGIQNVQPWFLMSVLGLILLNGLVWIWGISAGMLRKQKPLIVPL